LLPIGYLEGFYYRKEKLWETCMTKAIPFLNAQFKEPYKEKIRGRMEDIELKI